MVDLHDDSINLRALKRIDENIREILFNAGQVAIYYFNVDDGGWKRKEIEGALFFVRRVSHPEYAFAVINKLGTTNLVQKITKDLETNVQTPYLMYKNPENEIYCVWFYDRNSCIKLNEHIVEIIDRIKSQLLTQPMNHFNGGPPMPATNQAQGSNTELLKMLQQMSVAENNLNESVDIQKTPQQASDIPNDLVKPVAQRRSVNLKDLFSSQLVSTPANNNSNDITTPIKQEPVPAGIGRPEPVTPNQYIRPENMKINFQSPMIPQPSAILNNSNNISNSGDLLNDSMNQAPVKPTPFEALLQPQKLQQISSSLFEPKANHNQSGDSETSMYLTMEQLKKTLIYLLQNDADFLHSIHTTYVSAIKK